MYSVEGHTGLITGGTTGIGFETAKRSLELGAKSIIVTGQNKERLEEAEKELKALGKGEVMTVIWKSEEFQDSLQLAEMIKEKHQTLDFAFLNAGVCWATPLGSIDAEAIQQQIAINFTGPLVLLESIIPSINDGGSIVLTTSCLNQLGVPGYAAYAASKAGLRSLARTLSAELMDRNIRVNSIAPGPIETPIHTKYGINGAELDAVKEHVASLVPMGRFGMPKEIVDAVIFLISSSSSYMRGEEIVIDGGWSNL